jgi:hypothetical protein
MQRRSLHVATVLDKELRRLVTVDGADYTVALNPNGFRLTGKGKRRPEVELRWRDLLRRRRDGLCLERFSAAAAGHQTYD